MQTTAKETKNLSTKQDLVFRLFTSIVGKQEVGKMTAAHVDQIMVISEQAAERILAVRG